MSFLHVYLMCFLGVWDRLGALHRDYRRGACVGAYMWKPCLATQCMCEYIYIYIYIYIYVYIYIYIDKWLGAKLEV